MSEKIFILCQDDLGNYEIRYDDKIFHFLWEVAPILNEQQSTISQLKEENEQLKHYKLYEDNKRLQTIIADLKEENKKLRNIHLSIDLTYSYGYGRYLADVRVIDDE